MPNNSKMVSWWMAFQASSKDRVPMASMRPAPMTEAPVRSMRRPGRRPRPRTRNVRAKIRIVSICFGWLVAFSLIVGAAERPKELVAFADRVRALPPEFGADLLLGMAEGKVDPVWRRELTEEAFRLALRAPDIYATRGGRHTDTRAHMTSSIHGLDILSLRMRAVRAMLRDDPERAAGMFAETRLPTLPALECSATQVPDIWDYYRTLGMVFAKGFSARQRERGEPRHLLNAAIAGMHSPAQVVLLGKALLAVEADRQELLDAFAGALARVAPSDRVFARSSGELMGLVRDARRLGLDDSALLRGMQGYLAAHLSGPRCTPYLKDGAELGRAFNLLAGETAALTPEQMRPARDAGTWDDGEFWESARSKEVMAELRWLTHGNRDLPGDKRFWTLEERKSQEWTGRYADLLQKIEGWRESEEKAAVDFRWMQCQTLALGAKLVPPGPARDLAMRRWLTSFENWYEPGASQNAWFWTLKRMLEEKELVSGEMRRSRNAVVAAYAEWTAMAGGK